MTTISASSPSTPNIDLCHIIIKALEDNIRERHFDPKISKPFGDAFILREEDHSLPLQRRLEWFGDKFLNFLIGELMKPVFPRAPRGTLVDVHCALISNAVFREIGFRVGISQTLNNKAPADVFEAYANNVLVGFGMTFARKWAEVIFQPLVELSFEICRINGIITEDPNFDEDPENSLAFYEKFGGYRYHQAIARFGHVMRPEYLCTSSFKLDEPEDLGFTEGTVVTLNVDLVKVWMPVFRNYISVSINHPCVHRTTFDGVQLHVDWWPSEHERTDESGLIKETYTVQSKMNVDVQERKFADGRPYLRASLSHPLEIET